MIDHIPPGHGEPEPIPASNGRGSNTYADEDWFALAQEIVYSPVYVPDLKETPGHEAPCRDRQQPREDDLSLRPRPGETAEDVLARVEKAAKP